MGRIRNWKKTRENEWTHISNRYKVVTQIVGLFANGAYLYEKPADAPFFKRRIAILGWYGLPEEARRAAVRWMKNHPRGKGEPEHRAVSGWNPKWERSGKFGW